MKNIIFNFLILLFSINVHCQNQLNEEDCIAILSGNIESYRKYDVKSISLISDNNFVRSSINHNTDEKTLTIKNRESEYQYKYDEYNRTISLIFKNQSHFLSYFDSTNTVNSYKLKLDKDSVIVFQIISFPYKKYPKIEWTEVVKKSKENNDTIYFDYTKKVLNFKDSLNGYNEYGSINGYNRYYFSGNKEHFHKMSNTYIYESLHTNPNGKMIGEQKWVKGDSIYIKNYKTDSIYESYLKGEKLYHLKISYGKDLRLQEEFIYETETQKLLNSKKYIYFLFNNTNNLILWEIKTSDKITGKIVREYPNKENYKLKNNQVFEKISSIRKRQKKEKEEKERKYYSICKTEKDYANYEYLSASTSILIDLDRINDYFKDLEFYYSDQGYNHFIFPLNGDTLKFKSLVPFVDERNKEKIESEISNLIIKGSNRYRNILSNYKIEIITNDDKSWTINPLEYFDKVSPNLDLFLYREDY